MKSFISYIVEDSNFKIRDISHFQYAPNSQLGSNPGGVFTDPSSGKVHYAKFYHNFDQSRSEVAASHVYNLMGIHTVNHELAHYVSKMGVVSPWNGDLQSMHAEDYHNPSPNDRSQLAGHFHAAILTKNWDALGAGYENIMKHPHTGNLHSVDFGGVFKFRAQGGPKPYDTNIGEHQTLRDPRMNPQAANAFGKLTHDDIKSSAYRLHNLNHANVHAAFKSVGMADLDGHVKTLLDRRDQLAKLYS